MGKSIREVGVEDLVGCGVSPEEAKDLERELKDVSNNGGGAKEVWRRITALKLLKPWHPHPLHQLIYYSVYHHHDDSIDGPPLYWFPSLSQAKRTNLGRLMESHGPRVLGNSYKDPITSFKDFHQFSVQQPETYWKLVLNELPVQFSVPPKCILDLSDKNKHGGTWLPGAVLNIADCCLRSSSYLKKHDESLAVVWRQEGLDDKDVEKMTLKELREQVMLVANALDLEFCKGDAIAIDMQMTCTAVIIYLATVLAGLVVVPIADSFAPEEIATRLRVSNAKAIFTQVVIKTYALSMHQDKQETKTLMSEGNLAIVYH